MYKVIIADDEYWVLEKMKKLFNWSDYGFELIGEASNVNELITKVQQLNPDVIFLDIKMRGASGIEALREIRESGNKCKAVIISAYSDFKDAQLAIKYGAFEYRLKPIKQGEADEILQNLRVTLDEENGILEKEEFTDIDNKAFESMIGYIRENYRDKLYLGELSKKFYINPTYCCYLFKKHMGCSFTSFLTLVRMEHAASLLVTTSMTNKQIADYLGYDYYYFSKIFKKHYNMTPTQYRQEKASK